MMPPVRVTPDRHVVAAERSRFGYFMGLGDLSYQVGGDFASAHRNMKELVRLRNARNQATPVVEWKYVVFSWNDSEDEIGKAVELAREAKVDILSFWPGDGTPAQRSSRFREDRFFTTLGSASWKGREIDFRK